VTMPGWAFISAWLFDMVNPIIKRHEVRTCRKTLVRFCKCA
jgi:hypothetical protein